jgi:hypothetical protein
MLRALFECRLVPELRLQKYEVLQLCRMRMRI